MIYRFGLFLLVYVLGAISVVGQVDVLFVGNSLTYTNDLPEMVTDIGKTIDQEIRVTSLCYPNYGLEDHWRDGQIKELLKSGRFEYVIFQQGPSSQAYGLSSLVEYGAKIGALARQHGAQPAYLMVWPALQYYYTFPKVISNHEDAAGKNDAILIPAGKAWQQYRTGSFGEDLYSGDQFHPSVAGTLLTTLAIVHVLFPGLDSSEIPYRKIKALGVSKATWERIRLSVEENMH